MNLGEMLRAKLLINQINEATTPKEETPKVEAAPKRKPFQIGNNLNRALFEQAQCYPATRKNLTDRMVAMGYKRNSVSTIIQQMLRQGVLQPDDECVLHLTVAQYTPLKSARTMRKLEAAKPERKKVNLVIKRRVAEEERPVSSPPVVQESRVKTILRSVSILQARELYDELRGIFGDNK